MKTRILEKVGDRRWAVREVNVGARFYVLVVASVLFAYGLAGAVGGSAQ